MLYSNMYKWFVHGTRHVVCKYLCAFSTFRSPKELRWGFSNMPFVFYIYKNVFGVKLPTGLIVAYLVHVDKPLVQRNKGCAFVGTKISNDNNENNNIITTTLNVCITCSLTVLFVWFCSLVYIKLTYGIVQNISLSLSLSRTLNMYEHVRGNLLFMYSIFGPHCHILLCFFSFKS